MTIKMHAKKCKLPDSFCTNQSDKVKYNIPYFSREFYKEAPVHNIFPVLLHKFPEFMKTALNKALKILIWDTFLH